MKLFNGKGKGSNWYVWIGSFALLLMAWLWVGPKLIQKPAGTPPRSGSNEEAKEMTRTSIGVLPQPTGSVAVPQVMPAPPVLNLPPYSNMPTNGIVGPAQTARARISNARVAKVIMS